MDTGSHLCERAKAWVSLRADGELSELESALLDAHLGRCEACSAFAQRAGRIAAMLRAVPFEQPAAHASVAAPARRPGLRALQVAAALAVVASAGVVAAFSGPAGSAAGRPVSMVAGADSPDRLRELRRPALVEQGRSIPRNRPGVEEAV